MNVDPALLLGHDRFLRDLARSLLGDGGSTEDVMQETYLRAWTASPVSLDRPRSWLGRIARNLALNWKRGEQRRAARERTVAKSTIAPSVADIVIREEVRRRVVSATLSLPEVYREVLLLRFFEDLTPAGIARRLGVPGSTVRSRLQRGLAAVREHLEREDGGDRGHWRLTLVPLAAERHAVAFATFGLVGLALVSAGWLAFSVGSGTADLGVSSFSAAGQVTSAQLERASSRSTSDSALHRTNARSSPVAAVPAGGTVLALVHDERGRPVQGVGVALLERAESDSHVTDGPTMRAVTDQAGTVRFRGVAPGRARLFVQRETLAEGLLPPWKQEQSRPRVEDMKDGHAFPDIRAEHFATDVQVTDAMREVRAELTVVHAAGARGRIVTSVGAPLSGHMLRLQCMSGAEFAGLSSDARSDDAGGFRFTNVYPGRYRLCVFGPETPPPNCSGVGRPIPLPVHVEAGDELGPIEIVVGNGDRSVRGRVVDQDGMPFPGLWVEARHRAPLLEGERGEWSFALGGAMTDAHGEYRIEGLPAIAIGLQASVRGSNGLGGHDPNAKLAEWPWAPHVDLGVSSSELVAPEIRAIRSRKFRLEAEVIVDCQRYHGVRVVLDSFEVEFQRRDPVPVELGAHTFVRSLQERVLASAITQRTTTERSERGRFAWECETPQLPIRVRLLWRGDPAKAVASEPVDVVPVPNGTASITLRFP